MLLRPYISDDFDRLYAIETVCFEPPVRFTRGYLRSLLVRKRSFCWLAEQEGDAVGFGVVETMRRGHEVLAYIPTLEVLERWRRRGVGRELLLRLEDAATKAGAQSIWLHVDEHNAGAARLYEAAGYRCFDRQKNFYPQGHAALVYAKPSGGAGPLRCGSGEPDDGWIAEGIEAE